MLLILWLLRYILFHLRLIFWNFSDLKGIICAPKLRNDKEKVTVLVEELKAIQPLYLVY